MKRYVIIGAGNAGMSCVRTLRKYDESSEIVLLSHEDYPPYCRCLTTHYIEGKVDENVLFDRGKKMIASLKVDYRQGEEVEFIETKKCRIRLKGGKYIEYDRLFLSIGAEAKSSTFETDNSVPITTLRTLDDAKNIKSWLKKGDVAVLEGGGLVSLKTLLALYERGVKTFWVVSSPYILSFVLDRKSSGVIEDVLRKKGITIITGSSIVGIKNRVVKLSTGEEIKPGAVIVGKGVKSAAIASDEEISFNDGYEVNDYFQTNIENIYAGGDCAIVYDMVNKRKGRVALWPVAGEHGHFAALNMMGKKTKYRGSIQVNSFQVFNNYIIAGGKKRIYEGEEKDFYDVIYKKGNIFKRFVFSSKTNNMYGYVLINDVLKAGMYYYKVRDFSG